MNSFFRRINNDRGVAAIEFAIILPILIFLVMGILEFGWLFNGWVTIRSAAREGARVANAYKELDDTEYIKEAVRKHVSNQDVMFPALIPNIQNVDAQVSGPVLIEGNQNNPKEFGVTVTATGEMTPLIGFFVGQDNYLLVGEATMRIE